MSLEYEALTKVLEVAVMKVADDCMKTNAENAENAGLETYVTRRYDGVGLSGGRVCQWCLDRCGENVWYRDAVSQGMFERHPGCSCEIEYITEKGVQRQTDWTTNTWTNVQDAKTLQKRKQAGPVKILGLRTSKSMKDQILKTLAEKALSDI